MTTGQRTAASAWLRNRPTRSLSLWWREWCFFCVVWSHFWKRLFLLMLIVGGGGLLFVCLEPEKQHSLARGMYLAWSLLFANPGEDFPRSPVLQGLFFLIPILGLTVVIELIVDLAMVMRDRQKYERGWCRMMAQALSDHVVLIGLGKLGYRIYLLLKELGEQVVVIESNPANQFLENIRRDGSPLLIGDARRQAFLVDANIAKAKSIVLATDDDLANLETALDARQLSPKIRVVLRMFDQNMADKVGQAFNMPVALSPSTRAAPAFALAAMDPAITDSFIIDEQLIVMQRWRVHATGPLQGRTISQLMKDFTLGVVELKRPTGEVRLFPPPEQLLQPGDELVVQGPYDKLEQLRSQLPELGVEEEGVLLP
ncbi:MAG: hypothetical protein HJJLKODD_00465 [Phycisphaerae bacterium]|nr:hypothetical protein [Phycisphaerae bacterium]